MRLDVAGTPHARTQQIALVLSCALHNSLRVEHHGTDFTVADLADSRGDREQLRVLLLFARPEEAVAAAVAAQADVDESLATWSSAAERVLDLRERLGSRSLLLDGHRAHGAPEAMVAAVAAWLRVEATVPGASDSSTKAAVDAADEPLEAAIATHCIRQSPMVGRLAESLEKQQSALAGDSSVDVPDWRAALASYRQLVDDKVMRDRQLAQVQEALERYYLEAKELRDDRGGSSAEVDDLVGYALLLEREYTKVLRSRTWKAMAPVRELGRIVKSIMRGVRVPRNRLPRRPSLLKHTP